MRKQNIIFSMKNELKKTPEPTSEHGDLDDFIFALEFEKTVSER